MIKKEPAWTFQGSRHQSSADNIPGPGSYNPSSNNLDSPPNFSMGKSSRGFAFKATNPGPGAYSPNTSGKLSPRAT